MEITEATLDKLLHMVRLQASPQAKRRLRQQLGQVMSWIEQLQQVPVEGFEPLQTMASDANRLREDIPSAALPAEAALRNAPSRRGEYFDLPAFHRKGQL